MKTTNLFYLEVENTKLYNFSDQLWSLNKCTQADALFKKVTTLNNPLFKQVFMVEKLNCVCTG